MQRGRDWHKEHLSCARWAPVHMGQPRKLAQCGPHFKAVACKLEGTQDVVGSCTSSLKEADCLAWRSTDSWGTRSHSSKSRGQHQRENGGEIGLFIYVHVE